MKNILKHSNSKFCLIGKIKGLAAESKRTRQHLLKSKSEQSLWRLSCRKYMVGLDIRHHLLAYAFLRGTPYHKLEKTCNSKPDTDIILKIVIAHGAPYIWHNTSGVIEKINIWIKGEV